jgi:hypothetical protein
MTGLMDTPLHVLLGGGTQEQQEQAVANSFNTGGSFAGASSVVTKPRNALNMGFRVFHGSPHDFPPVRLIEMPDGQRLYQNMDELMDTPQGAKIIQEFPMGRFDMSKIGTGEGAQAYGHGLYFAETEDVAKGYRDRIAGAEWVDKRGVAMNSNTIANDVMDEARKDGMGVIDAQELAGLWSTVARNPEGTVNLPGYTTIKKVLDRHGIRLREKGSMYEVSINADPDAFLDWDKPLSEQPEAVRKSLEGMIGAPAGSNQMLDANFNAAPGKKGYEYKADGGTVYRNLDTGGGKVAEKLREAGIPGIKYLDAGSRGAGDGTRNYVVFDEKLVSIVKKYGIAGASAMLGYNILEGMDPAQAEELQRIEGNQ